MLLIKNLRLPNFDTLTTSMGQMLIDGDRIVKIGSSIEAQAEVLDADGKLILPAMVDTHTHMVQSLTKGPLDDLNITDWLKKMLFVQWQLTEKEWYYGVLLGCLQSLRFGVTAINEMTYWNQIDAVAQAYKDAGIRATFGIGATDIAENAQVKVTPLEENLRQAEYLYNTYNGKGLLRTSVAPQGRPACTPELMKALHEFSSERGLIYHTHLAEGISETRKIREWTGRGEAEELNHLGVLDQRTVLAHSIWLENDEIGLIAQSGATVAHCPSTNMKLSDGVCIVSELLQSGARVAFGCDGEASSANRDLIREARLGSYLQKVTTLDPTVLPASQCFKMLTVGGAEALGYKDLGKLEEGCLADFSLVRTDDISTTNQARILTNLLYAGSGYQVDSVFVGGKSVMFEGELLHHDINKVMDKCESILDRVEYLLR